jgi:hypothetical protein
MFVACDATDFFGCSPCASWLCSPANNRIKAVMQAPCLGVIAQRDETLARCCAHHALIMRSFGAGISQRGPMHDKRLEGGI